MSEVITAQSLGNLRGDVPLYGVIGWPVAHSLSPAMQEAAFRACGLSARYLKIALAPEELAAGVEAMRRLPFAGWNCTIPHKNALFPLMDRVEASAEAIGGVNTVVNRDGTLEGHSTDGAGWSRAIREDFGVEVRDQRILLLGAGGAGRAIAHQAVREGCRSLVLVNRTLETAHELARELDQAERVRVVAWENGPLAGALDATDLIVNASSVGLKAEDPPALAGSLLRPDHLVYDTIYNPSPTGLLREAARAGARTANGLSMLLHQGALSFEIWTGKEAPVEEMRQALAAEAKAHRV
ncbi:MAG: shikimate dehydrogenase [Candidatus Methylacidiphilales bacterium]|nr:shikimate dehydrogenase [Candidatus Methylacidiphilales bacterium]